MTGEQIHLCIRRYLREVRLVEIQRLEVHTNIVAKAKELIEKVKNETHKHGITQEMYNEFCAEYHKTYMSCCLEEMTQQGCLVWLRHEQRTINEFPIPPIECQERMGGCKEDCPEFIKATEEQTKRYMHGRDVDTDKLLNIDILEEQSENNS